MRFKIFDFKNGGVYKVRRSCHSLEKRPCNAARIILFLNYRNRRYVISSDPEKFPPVLFRGTLKSGLTVNNCSELYLEVTVTAGIAVKVPGHLNACFRLRKRYPRNSAVGNQHIFIIQFAFR